MSIAYYIVEPCPAVFPGSFIVRIYAYIGGYKNCLGSWSVPVRSPDSLPRYLNEAHQLGELLIKSVVL